MRAADQLPPGARESLTTWITHGIDPGGFLLAVLSNDLMESVAKADDNNMHLLPVYAKFLYNDTPSGCHGSRQNVEAWVNARAADPIEWEWPT